MICFTMYEKKRIPQVLFSLVHTTKDGILDTTVNSGGVGSRGEDQRKYIRHKKEIFSNLIILACKIITFALIKRISKFSAKII